MTFGSKLVETKYISGNNILRNASFKKHALQTKSNLHQESEANLTLQKLLCANFSGANNDTAMKLNTSLLAMSATTLPTLVHAIIYYIKLQVPRNRALTLLLKLHNTDQDLKHQRKLCPITLFENPFGCAQTKRTNTNKH